MGRKRHKKDKLGDQPADGIKMVRHGRSPELINLRNIKLMKRYYQLFEIERMRFDDVLNKLKYEEFFVEEQTLLLIIRKNSHLYDALLNGESIDMAIPTHDENQLKLEF
jgi:hypothetical protein